MPCHRIGGAFVSVVGTYKAGDSPPDGYTDWHEWARVQHAAGLRQVRCPRCSRFAFPQETNREAGVCIKCASKPDQPQLAP